MSLGRIKRITFIVFFSGFAIVLMPILNFLILERVGGAKHLQKVSGVHPVVFWLGNWLFDFFYLMLIFALVLPMFLLATEPFPDVSHFKFAVIITPTSMVYGPPIVISLSV